MRIVFATTLTVAVLTLTTGGCGSISQVSDDGGATGEAGTTGQAGTTGSGGRAGNGGPAGASGHAGSTGIAGNSGVAGNNTGVAGSTGLAGSNTGVAGSNTGIAGTTGVAGSGRGGTTGLAGTTGVAGSGPAGRGGTTGLAGSGPAGRGGTTGVAGSGTGQAGSSGTGSGGSGPNEPVCPPPTKIPVDGTTCLREGITCEYGDDPRGDHCRTIALCSSQQWKVTKPDGRDCTKIEYPPCTSKPNETCDPAGSYCYQPDGAACGCNACGGGNMICLPGASPRLGCTMPSSQGCPAGEPNMGTPCEPEMLSCSYCPDTSRICSKGIWIPGKALCPVN